MREPATEPARQREPATEPARQREPATEPARQREPATEPAAAPGHVEATEDDVGQAFPAAPGAGPVGPPGVRWDPTEAPAPASRRRPPIGVVVVVAITVAITVVVLVVLAADLLRAPPPDPEPVEPDRYALDQVAQRYRALGATLLDGAAGCARGDPEPGQVEAVGCTFGNWTLTLVTYDTAGRLAGTRERAVAAPADAVRDTRRVETDAAFALHETAAGGTTVYWDVATPRPVSATAVSSALTLPELVARYDARGSTVLERPELPGPAFASGALWSLATRAVGVDGARCEPLPAAQKAERAAVDGARCALVDGRTVEFVEVADYADLTRTRARYTSGDGTVPGTLRNVGGWNFGDESEARGQYSEFVSAADGASSLYFDEEATLCVGLISHPALTQDELRRTWER